MSWTPKTCAMGLALIASCAMAGCTSSLPSLPKLADLNPFSEKDPPLPGRRISILPEKKKIPGELADAATPITLPAQVANTDWTQPGGEPDNAPGHLTLAAAVRQTWSADAGAGSSKKGRVTASPIVYGGRVFTLDSNGMVSAFSLSGGGASWKASLKPTLEEKEKASGFDLSWSGLTGGEEGGGYGGGLAVDEGRIYGASGHGAVVALDPQTGKRLWEKYLGLPVRASPTAAGGKVFVVTIDGRFHCLSGIDGTEVWSVRGLPQTASLILNVSPAVDGDLVIVPYPSGDLVAIKVSDGTPVWSENLSRTRSTSQLASLSDAARPAIDGGTVFAVGHAGRMIATQASSGERLWSLNVPGTQTPWVAGDNVFVVDTAGQLLAISRGAGKIKWTTKLPGSSTWSGPTLAGGTLWLASNKGQLVGVDAATGRVSSQQNLGGAVYVAPVVAQSRMFVLTDSAKLIALN
ncbi:MAG: PQQ-binding-like beta-propeller repeat protein [Alphaproteobacteria bacterium]|nr:PQQ-binding-like beta-propeller repeat protein [Alphaproteobacteria bacterium]